MADVDVCMRIIANAVCDHWMKVLKERDDFDVPIHADVCALLEASVGAPGPVAFAAKLKGFYQELLDIVNGAPTSPLTTTVPAAQMGPNGVEPLLCHLALWQMCYAGSGMIRGLGIEVVSAVPLRLSVET